MDDVGMQCKCAGCGTERDIRRLKVCVCRAGDAYYCNRACQRKHYNAGHRETCESAFAEHDRICRATENDPVTRLTRLKDALFNHPRTKAVHQLLIARDKQLGIFFNEENAEVHQLPVLQLENAEERTVMRMILGTVVANVSQQTMRLTSFCPFTLKPPGTWSDMIKSHVYSYTVLKHHHDNCGGASSYKGGRKVDPKHSTFRGYDRKAEERLSRDETFFPVIAAAATDEESTILGEEESARLQRFLLFQLVRVVQATGGTARYNIVVDFLYQVRVLLDRPDVALPVVQARANFAFLYGPTRGEWVHVLRLGNVCVALQWSAAGRKTAMYEAVMLHFEKVSELSEVYEAAMCLGCLDVNMVLWRHDGNGDVVVPMCLNARRSSLFEARLTVPVASDRLHSGAWEKEAQLSAARNLDLLDALQPYQTMEAAAAGHAPRLGNYSQPTWVPSLRHPLAWNSSALFVYCAGRPHLGQVKLTDNISMWVGGGTRLVSIKSRAPVVDGATIRLVVSYNINTADLSLTWALAKHRSVIERMPQFNAAKRSMLRQWRMALRQPDVLRKVRATLNKP